MTFRALLTELDGEGSVRSTITTLEDERLPQGNVLVGVDWAGFNYKDGMVLAGRGGLVKSYPHIGGVDFAGRVIESSDPRYHPGQAVVLTGWRVGEWHWGGFATRARVDADWLAPMPKGLSTRDAMVLGTAGLTAMLAVQKIRVEGIKPADGPILVTGAGGGVGSMATLLLARLGYRVEAMTGRSALAGDLENLGASAVVGREVLDETSKTLLKPRWAAAIDSVGGAPLGEIIKQIQPGGCVAAIGLAAGDRWQASVIPFILRGVTLAGIDSVMQPYETRVAAWERLASLFGFRAYEPWVTEARLEELAAVSGDILRGTIKGRVIVNPK